jgi:hypothetical protein
MAQATVTADPVADRADRQKVRERAQKSERLSKVLPDKVHTWPYLVRLEMMVGTAIMTFVTIWSIVVDAPLEEPANPTKTPNPSKAPWYFLGLQELLVYFDPWFAGVVLPGMIIVGLMVIPYVDINPRGNGYYSFRERWFAVSFFLFGFVVLWISTIIIGTFIRGPGWYLFWPGQYWDVHKTVAITNLDWAELCRIPKFAIGPTDSHSLWGAASVAGFLFGIPAAFWKLRAKKSPVLQKLGAVRYWIVALFVWSTAGVVLKMILRLVLNVKYIWVGPMGFNI